jgi:hypothetical protein
MEIIIIIIVSIVLILIRLYNFLVGKILLLLVRKYMSPYAAYIFIIGCVAGGIGS